MVLRPFLRRKDNYFFCIKQIIVYFFCLQFIFLYNHSIIEETGSVRMGIIRNKNKRLAAAALLCMFWLRIMSLRQFGGMSGDLAGWFLQTEEICMLAVLVIIEKAAAL